MRFLTLRPRELAASLVIALAAFAPALLRMGHLFPQDWHYFNDLSWTVRSEILHYGRFPLHDPWFCGGLDLIQNPQNRILSPFGLLDLALAPQWANLISILIYASFGALGMLVFLREEMRLSFPVAATISALFIGSSWFGLHFSEGHVPFGSLQLLPWVYLLGRRIGRDDRTWVSLFALALLFAIMILDGGIYAFVFSIVLVATLPVPYAAIRRLASSPRNGGLALLIALACLFLALGKMYPVLQALRHRERGSELTIMPLRLILTSLFYPKQGLDLPIDSSLPWRFQEFGCYIGVIAPLVVLWGARRGGLRYSRRVWLPALLFLWTGSGLLDRFNPWNLFRHIPVLNNVHVKSRMFLLFFFLSLLMLASALEALRSKSLRTYVVVTILLLAEFAVVRTHTLAFLSTDAGKPIAANEFIQSTTILDTVAWGYGPSHLRYGNRGTLDCYEPAFMGTKVQKTGDPDYHGEAYVASGAGVLSLKSYIPGRIEADYLGLGPATLGFNTRVLAGWSPVAPAGATVHPVRGTGLLGVDVTHGPTHVVLEYTPHYLRPMLFFFFLGWILFGLAAWRVKKLGEEESPRPYEDGQT